MTDSSLTILSETNFWVIVCDIPARQTPSPGDGGRGRGLRPGGKGPSPPEEPFGGFKLKAVPLKFVKKIKDIVLQEAESIGSSAVFECEVSPSTAITSWMKDGSNLREGPKHKFTADGKDRKLNIIDVQLSDTGEYTCVAKNAGKEITCTAKLIVEGKLSPNFVNISLKRSLNGFVNWKKAFCRHHKVLKLR